MLRRTIRILMLFSSIVVFLPLAAAADDEQPALPDALRQVEVLLASGGGTPQEVQAAITLLKLAAEGDGEDVTAPLVRFLVAHLRPLASSAEPPGEARREELVRRAVATADALAAKLAAAAVPSGRATAASLSPPANDACASSALLSEGVLTATTSGATNDGAASCGASATAPDVWYSYTASTDGLVAWDSFDSTLDTVLSLHSACPDAGGDHELACSDDARGVLGSQVVLEMSAGETVLVRLSGAGGASGSFQLRTNAAPGGISGTVRKATTGEPVAEAIVELFHSSGFTFDEAVTGDDGEYLFAGLDARSWFLRTFHQAYPLEIWDDRPCGAFTCDPSRVGDPVAVTTGLTSGIDFELEPGGAIEGTISEADGGAPIGALVSVFGSNGGFAGDDFAGTGSYSVGGLRPGSYFVRVESFAFQDELYDDISCEPACNVTAGAAVAVAQGSTTPGIDFALRRMGSLSGTLTNSLDGSAVGFQDIIAFDAAGDFARSSFSSSDGSYTIFPLDAGNYFVRTTSSIWGDELYDDIPCEPTCTVTTGTAVPVALGVETTGIDFALDPPGEIAGSLTAADGSPFFRSDLIVYDHTGAVARHAFDVAGNYVFALVPPGTYFVAANSSFASPEYEDQLYSGIGCDPSCEVTGGTPVVVSSGVTTNGVDLALRRCSLASHRTVANLFFFGFQTAEACRTVSVGPNVTVGGTGLLVLRAGESVVFGDGFSVQSGGRLEVTIDPEVGLPE